jgi:hypothetical protein
MIENGLRESLARGVRAEISVEAEGLHDWEISLDGEERSSGTLLFAEDVTSTAGENTIDTTHSTLGNLNLDQENRLKKTWFGKEGRGVQDTAGSWNKLSTTTMDRIGVEGNIHDVESARTHWLFGDWSFTGSPLETGDDGILDFVQVLNGLSLVNQQVGTVSIWAETPDLTGIGDIPAEVVSQDTGTSLEIVTGANSAGLDFL